MSVRDFSNDLHKSSRTIGFERILNILQSLQKQTPKIEDDDLLRFFMYGPLTDVHDTDITLSPESIREILNSVHYATKIYKKYIPLQVKPYDLTHDNSDNTLALRLASNLHPARPPIFSAGVFTPGNASLRINDHPLLNPTDALSIAFWVFVPYDIPTFLPFFEKRIPPDDFSFSFLVSHIPTNNLVMRFKESNGNICVLNGAATVNAWNHVTVTFHENDTTKLYINNILQEELQTTSSLNVTSARVQIFQGVNYAPEGLGIAWLSLIHGDVSIIPNWIRNDMNGIRDMDHPELEEITTMPFLRNLRPEPNAVPGFCYAY